MDVLGTGHKNTLFLLFEMSEKKETNNNMILLPTA